MDVSTDLGRDCLLVNAEGCHVTSDDNRKFTYSDGARYCAHQLGHMADVKSPTVGIIRDVHAILRAACTYIMSSYGLSVLRVHTSAFVMRTIVYAITRVLYPSVVDQVMAGVQAEAAAQSWSSVWTGARIRGFDWLWTETGQCLDARLCSSFWLLWITGVFCCVAFNFIAYMIEFAVKHTFATRS